MLVAVETYISTYSFRAKNLEVVASTRVLGNRYWPFHIIGMDGQLSRIALVLDYLFQSAAL